MARKFITYFEKQGNDYTDELINAVKDKLELSDNINKVLIASATGKSALKLREALGKDVHELIEKMETEGDVHKVNFKRIYGRWPVDKRERGSVKSLVFGLIYGRGIPSIAEQIGEKPAMTREEASAELRSEGFSEKLPVRKMIKPDW